MGWKNWRCWVKGSVIGLLSALGLIGLTILGWILKNGLFYKIMFILATPVISLVSIIIGCRGGEECQAIGILLSFIGILFEGVLIGLITGLIIGNVKSRNKQK